MKKSYDIQDVINAECMLDPIKCRGCGSLEVAFMSSLGDALCQDCGRWQLDIIQVKPIRFEPVEED